MTPTDHVLNLADAFAAATGLARSTISTRVFGDGKVLGNLATGRDLYTRRYTAALAWFSAHWPEGAAWPGEVPRPDVQAADVAAGDSAEAAA